MSDGAPDTAYTFRFERSKIELVKEIGEEHHRTLVGEMRQMVDEWIAAHRPESLDREAA